MLLRRGGGVVCGPLRSLAAAGRVAARGNGFALLYVPRSASVCVSCAATPRFCMQRIRARVALAWTLFGTSSKNTFAEA